ncbi:imidazole glycerol phosphate synthase subunit HisH [Methanococcus maripaludis]|uniref:Imidazole glycerol phosphate synthase subunit HisH n=1 Tax=Methanococcus maripaludis TaxID=39152 RepID=A0A7J9PVB4_METMI|nr:imidazole glycerol phosphate synthase subunit HisH [Methanococcus maripaludis]MBA2868490.1 glutamine amidotransferase [Methanococcus maripaludis]
MIAIIDYGMGNVGSIKNMIAKIGFDAIITDDPELISKATKLILPGVGSFDSGMTNLKDLGLIDILDKKVVQEKTPLLGICLGMQLLTNSSEEGCLKGLGFINAKTVKFKLSDRFKIPHMGWNYVKVIIKNKLSDNLIENSRFYFVHSYYVICEDKKNILMTTEYENEFASAFSKDNIYGVQFHPEKSHKFGMKLIENFIKKV